MTSAEESDLRKRVAEIKRLEWLEHFSGVLAVVESVGPKYRPKKVDWSQLKREIDSAIWWIDSRYVEGHKRDHSAESAYQALEDAAKRVSNLHDENRDKYLAMIDSARNNREYEKRVRENWAALNKPMSATVGRLSWIFEEHFGRKAMAGSAKDGPFIRFCLAVLNNYRDDPKKKPIAVATVVSAFNAFKKQQRQFAKSQGSATEG